jgi:hypothetical protein
MKIVCLLLSCAMLGALISGCQTDFSGPDVSMKILYKGENGDQEHLSRGSGMSSSTGYGDSWCWGKGCGGNK